jgi:succinate dehydrogenase / fumarate reductase flavoprotein subunit
MIRTLQNHAVARGIDVLWSAPSSACRSMASASAARSATGASGRFVVFKSRAVVLGTGGIGKIYKITSNSWEYTGDGLSLALQAGADLIDMEMVQFHPTGMVWPPSVRGILVTESVRGDGGTLKNTKGERFMFNYVPDFFRAETADNEKEADGWYEDKRNNRRTPDLLPRDEVARAINAEVKAGRGTEHGGVFLDIASRRPADYIRKRLPSMYHQFKELADVDITAEPMEVGPTCHYMMGGVRVDADTAATRVRAVRGGRGGGRAARRQSTGGNSLSDLLVFGRRAGQHAAEYALGLPAQPGADANEIEQAAGDMLAPFERTGEENPYAIQSDLETCMQDLVGIIRVEAELNQALERIAELKARVAHVHVEGNRHFNPGWHLALALDSMLLVSDAIARSALVRKESRGGHTRSDFPDTDARLARINLVTRQTSDGLGIVEEPLPEMPPDLQGLLAEGGDTSGRHDARLARRHQWRAFATTPSVPKKAWSCSTSSIASRPPRRPIWPCAGTARRAKRLVQRRGER